MFGLSLTSFEFLCCVVFVILCCIAFQWFTGGFTFSFGNFSYEGQQQFKENGLTDSNISVNDGGSYRHRWMDSGLGMAGANTSKWPRPLDVDLFSGVGSSYDLMEKLHQTSHQLAMTRRRVAALHREITALDEENHKLFCSNQRLKRHCKTLQRKLHKLGAVEATPKSHKCEREENVDETPSDSDNTAADDLVLKSRSRREKSGDLLNNNREPGSE